MPNNQQVQFPCPDLYELFATRLVVTLLPNLPAKRHHPARKYIEDGRIEADVREQHNLYKLYEKHAHDKNRQGPSSREDDSASLHNDVKAAKNDRD